ncbi:MAG TPA: exodeoxyribonuclease VII small subunit, partial [Phycisphaerales bacterium]|nr:exodeoxyribonuclease VII small subunit [Phycisphaerales bacterium]
GELPLEEAMAEHARGEALLKRCRALLDGAETQLRSFDQSATDASDEDSA